MPAELKKSTKDVLKEELKLDKLADVLDREYLDITVQDDIDRNKTERFSKHIRGSVRLNRGMFYTAREFEDWTNKVKHIKMP